MKTSPVRVAAFVACAAFLGCPHFSSAQRASQPDRAAQDKRPAGMSTFSTTYYQMHTDLPREAAQEAALRMDWTVEEYRKRTREFGGDRKPPQFPFYLFQRPEDYWAAGGPPGSAGVFMTRGGNDKRLMAIAGEETTDRTWHVIQHEGFHQFADATFGRLPPWVNEGLAEYFGEAVWTGDGFVTGLLPPDRVKVVKDRIARKRFLTLPDMMLLKHEQWNAAMSVENYHQAWSMAHFLAHGEDGKYQKAFTAFMRGVAGRQPWERAWLAAFGPADQFEARWAAWWAGLPDDPTPELYTEVTVRTLASFLARAHAGKLAFADLPAFVRAAEAGELKLKPDAGWLPPKLLDRAIAGMRRDETTFALEPGEKGQPQRVVAVRPDGRRLTATFPAKHKLPVLITVEATGGPAAPTAATSTARPAGRSPATRPAKVRP